MKGKRKFLLSIDGSHVEEKHVNTHFFTLATYFKNGGYTRLQIGDETYEVQIMFSMVYDAETFISQQHMLSHFTRSTQRLSFSDTPCSDIRGDVGFCGK